MARSKRVKRPKLNRTAPRRTFVATDSPEQNGNERLEPPPSDTKSAEESDFRKEAYDAINGGYRVIDEYMRQGQRLAEEFWLPLPGSKGALPDFSRLMDRFLKSAGDMGSAWLEMMTEWSKPATNGTASTKTAGPFTAGRANGHAASTTPARGEIAVEIETSRKVRVSVDAPAQLDNIDMHPLAAADQSLPPVTNVRLETDPVSGRRVLCLRVADEQPPGAYYGVLLDRASARPVGTITLILE